jgi:hypothetical protein
MSVSHVIRSCRFSLCCGAALLLAVPPVTAQVAEDAEAVSSFLSRGAMEMVEDIQGMVKEMSEAIREGMDLSEFIEAQVLACLEEWAEMIDVDRIDCLRPMMRPWLNVVEQVPGLGTLMMNPDFTTLGPGWSVEQDDDRLFVRVGSDDHDRGEILFFDGSRLTIQFRSADQADEQVMLFALPAGEGGGRNDDAIALEGSWALVQLDELSLRDLPSPAMIQEFRSDGSFRMSMTGGGETGSAPHLTELSPEGRWRLSISRAASASRTGEPRTRLLVLASEEGDHEHGHFIFAVEQLDAETLILVDKGRPGRPGGASLHFRRQ